MTGTVPDYLPMLPLLWREHFSTTSTTKNNLPLPPSAVIATWCETVGLDETTCAALLVMAERLRNDTGLHKLFQALQHAVLPTAGETTLFAEDPALELVFSPADVGLLYLLLPLCACPTAQALYDARGWPQELLHETLDDLRVWNLHHIANRGSPGITWRIVLWLRHHITGEVIRFGRLQAQPAHSFAGKVEVYRHHDTGQIVTLLESGLNLRTGGRLAGDEIPTEQTWTSLLSKEEDRVTGHPVSSSGTASRTPIQLDPSQGWNCILRRGDPAINLHIPATGPLTPDACADSFRRIRDFVARFLPERRCAALVCYSWMLDGQLADLLPPESNLIHFQRMGHLFPHENQAETVFRVFGEKAVQDGVDSVPHISSMQKALAKFLQRGGTFQSGGFFILPEEQRD